MLSANFSRRSLVISQLQSMNPLWWIVRTGSKLYTENVLSIDLFAHSSSSWGWTVEIQMRGLELPAHMWEVSIICTDMWDKGAR